MKREEELTVSVKPLEWETINDDHSSADFLSESVVGRYGAWVDRTVDPNLWHTDYPGKPYGGTNHQSVEDAKAAAQADYEARIRSALLATPKPEAEPVAWTTQTQLDAAKQNPGKNHYMWGEPLPYHPDIPLYAHPPKPEATDDWFSQVVAFFVKHGMLDERDEYDIRDIMAALHDNYAPEAEGVDHQVHYSKPVASQNTQIVEDNATEGGAHGNGLARLKAIETAAAAYVASVNGGPGALEEDWAWRAYDDRKLSAFEDLRAALTSSKVEGRS